MFCAASLVDAGHAEIDERHAMAGREDARDALARGDAFFDEGGGERPGLLRPAARERELVGRDELRRREQVDDELDRVTRAESAGRERRRSRTDGLGARRSQRRSIGFVLAHDLG